MSIEDSIADAVIRRLKAEGLLSATTDPPKVMAVREAAAYMHRSQSGVRKLIATGEIPCHIVKKFGGRTVLVRAELDKWLEATR